MNTNLLRAEMAMQGMTGRQVAEKAGISRSAFSAKLNGIRSFDADEVIRICDVLAIHDPQKKIDIFLTKTSQ